MTLKERTDWVLALGVIYHPQTTFSPQIIHMNIQLARDMVFKRYFLISEHLFRKTISITSGANFPSDFARYAENAVTGTTPLTYIDPPLLAQAGVNPFLQARASAPKIYFANQQIITEPASSIEFEYYAWPIQLFYKDNSVLTDTQIDALDDNMPPESDALIVRAAVERNMQMLYTREKAMELLVQREAEAQKVSDQFYKESALMLAKDVRTRQ